MAAEATGAIQGTAMEISVSKFELLKELTATQGVVERKTTIPILSNFLFEAANDRLTITGTDLDLSLRTSGDQCQRYRARQRRELQFPASNW